VLVVGAVARADVVAGDDAGDGTAGERRAVRSVLYTSHPPARDAHVALVLLVER
jgi:hypothetical protein